MNYGYSDSTHGDGVLSVSQVNRYVKALMENDALLSTVSVRGEISNLKYHSSGHLYFTLKDAESELSAVMFRSSAATMKFAARNGMRVTAYGRISVYEKSGKYQIYVSAMTDDGVGALRMEYERLLKKLSDEGLFEQARKKPIPKIPKCIGIITSPTGAAVRDMINVTGRRWPMAKILVYPSLVQGTDAPASLCQGLYLLNAAQACDVIIIGRGGGSIEDLWAFNDERVARAIAESTIPIISAVGHETDFTISDFVADLRAPTPSVAAELVVPDREEVKQRLDEAFEKTDSAFQSILLQHRQRVDALGHQIELLSPTKRLEAERELLSHKYALITNAIKQKLSAERERLGSVAGRLSALDPLSVLGRGYSITMRPDGGVIGSSRDISAGESISIKYVDGIAEATVNSVELTTTRRRKAATQNGD